jgi:imidazolonepropionase-like amidohydrolase
VALDRLKRAHRIGIEIAYGSDILMERPGLTRGDLSIAPLDTWAKAGLPAEDILRAMTVNGARLLGIEDQRGGIQPGMAADLIATPNNPLDDILALKQVSLS